MQEFMELERTLLRNCCFSLTTDSLNLRLRLRLTSCIKLLNHLQCMGMTLSFYSLVLNNKYGIFICYSLYSHLELSCVFKSVKVIEDCRL